MIESSPNQLPLLRKQSGLSQKQLAVLIGQDRTLISMYERGRVVPTLASAITLQLLFGVNVAEIFPKLRCELERDLGTRRLQFGRRIIREGKAQ